MSPRDQAEVLADAVVMLDSFAASTELQAAGDLSGVDSSGVEFALETLDVVAARLVRVAAVLRGHASTLADASTGLRRSS